MPVNCISFRRSRITSRCETFHINAKVKSFLKIVSWIYSRTCAAPFDGRGRWAVGEGAWRVWEYEHSSSMALELVLMPVMTFVSLTRQHPHTHAYAPASFRHWAKRGVIVQLLYNIKLILMWLLAHKWNWNKIKTYGNRFLNIQSLSDYNINMI